MNIDIDMNVVHAAINKTITAKAEQAVQYGHTADMIGNALAATMTDGAVTDAVREGVARVDIEAIADTVGQELTRATKQMVQHVLCESLADVVCKVRGIESFQAEYAEKRAEIMEQMRSEK